MLRRNLILAAAAAILAAPAAPGCAQSGVRTRRSRTEVRLDPRRDYNALAAAAPAGARLILAPGRYPRWSAAPQDGQTLDSGLFRKCTLKAVRPVPTIRKDIRDVEAGDLDGIDAVIHLAGLSNDPLGDLNARLTYAINHEATVRLGELAKRRGVRRFLYASSCSVYGAAGDDFLNEASSFNPVTPYAGSKACSEIDLQRLADPSFCPAYLRAATAYGVSPLLRCDLAVNNLVAWAGTTGRVFLKSSGTSWRPLTHIEDIAQAYVTLLRAPEALVHNRAFNIGRTEENYRIRDIAELVRQIVPNTRIEFAVDASEDHRNYRVNCDLIQLTLPQYRPRWTAAQGIQEVYETILAMGLNSDDFEGPRYNRIAYLKQLLVDGRVGEDLRWLDRAAVAAE